jgi:hypothetical protein
MAHGKGQILLDSQSVPVTVRCGKCGSDALDVPDRTDDSCIVTCTACNTAVGKWGDIKVKAVQHVQEAVGKEFKDGLRKAFEGDEYITIE